jgi:hypothetical protein
MKQEYEHNDFLTRAYGSCELKKINGRQVAEYIFSENEVYRSFVIEYLEVMDGKLGETMIHIWENGSGNTVYAEILK